MEPCAVCGGTYHETQITYSQDVNGHFVLVEHVPALVCERCGDTLLAPKVVEKLQSLVWQPVEPKRFEQVPVFDLALGSAAQ
jgi:HTH-type transcriptional regulator/antitoxin MqsA